MKFSYILDTFSAYNDFFVSSFIRYEDHELKRNAFTHRIGEGAGSNKRHNDSYI